MSIFNNGSSMKMSTFDDLFGNTSPDNEQVQKILLSDLHDFNGHPYKVLDDEKMQQLVESIKENGVLVPGTVRPKKEGGYEIISGHRRKHACELAGLLEMPVFVRDISDDEAIVTMVDSNLQRETISLSEKARALRMKYFALKHQGAKGGNSLEELADATGESTKTVQRFVSLGGLSDGLLDLVDENKIGIRQGVCLSFLEENQQEWVFRVLQKTGTSISEAQAEKIREKAKNGILTFTVVEQLLLEKKPQSRKFTLKEEKIREYFPATYSSKQIEDVIFQLLETWKAQT